jgi:CHAT domain-containing protein/Tfp pilus assembly protein PilF
MPISRNLRWIVLAGVGLIAGAGLLFWALRPARREPALQPAKKEGKPVANEVKIVGEVRKLEPGKVIEAELKGGEGHAYEVDLKTGEYAYVVAEQKGVDVAVVLIGPDGQRIIKVDSPNDNMGPEPVHEIAETGGAYRIEVLCEDFTAAKGDYEIKIVDLRTATEIDRKRVTAERKFFEGEELRRKNRAEPYRQALDKYKEALPIWRDLGEEEQEAETLRRIGWVSQDLSHLDEALSAYRDSLTLFRKLKKRDAEILLLSLIGSIEFRRFELDESFAAQEEALKLARENGSKDLEAGALINLGNIYTAKGEVQKALESYRSAIALAKAIGDTDSEHKALFGLGDVLTYQGKLESAADSLEEAIRIEEQSGNQREKGRTLRRLADLHQRLDQTDLALQELQEARSLAEAGGDAEGEAVTLNSLGTIYLRVGQGDLAGESYRKALSIFQRIKAPHGEAFALLNLGRYTHEVTHDLAQSLKFYDQAVERFRATGVRRGEVSALYGAARVLHDQKEFSGARERLERVVQGLETLRSESESQDLRASFFGTKQHYYELLIDVMMHLHEEASEEEFVRQAFEVNENRRARSFLEALAESGGGKQVDPALLARQRAVQQDLNATEQVLLVAKEKHDETQAAAVVRKQNELIAELEEIRSKVFQSRSGGALTGARPLTLPEIQEKVLDSKALLLVYSLGDERSFLWSVSREGGIHGHVLPSRKLLESEAKNAMLAWSDKAKRSGDSRWAERLSRELLAPVAEELKDRRLLIVTDGALQSLPFAALTDPNPMTPGKSSWLVERHEVVHLPSASVLSILRTRRSTRGVPSMEAGVFADPVFEHDDSRFAPEDKAFTTSRSTRGGDLERAGRDVGILHFSRLPYTADEADAISKLLGAQVVAKLGFEASRSTLENLDLEQFRILHFATHGILNQEHPELSGLVLSLLDEQGVQQDGFLYAHEISGMDLWADLVVLSACQTGLGREVKGEGVMNLTRSFMVAGAPRVVVSLWNVSDKATAELMRRFYEGFVNYDLSASRALRCAQISMLKAPEWKDPYYWAPFIFQGEWRRGGEKSSDGSIEKKQGSGQSSNLSDDDLPGDGDDKVASCPDFQQQ